MPTTTTTRSFTSPSVTTEATIATDQNDTGTIQSTTSIPIRTTKALLLSVTVPRIHRVYISPPKHLTTSNNSNDNSSSTAPPTTTTTKNEEDILVVDPNNTDLVGKKQGQNITNGKNKKTSTDGDKVDSKRQSIKQQEQQKATTKLSTVDKDKQNTNLKENSKDNASNIDDTEKSETSQQQIAEGEVIAASSTLSPSTEKNTAGDEVIVMEEKKETEKVEEEHVVVGYIQNDNDVDGSKDTKVLDVVTAEELATVVRLDETSPSPPSENEGNNCKNEDSAGGKGDDSEKKDETADSSSSTTNQTQEQEGESQPPNNNNNPINALKNMVFAVMKVEEEPIMLDKEQTLRALSLSSSVIPPFHENDNIDDDIPQMVETGDNNEELPPQIPPTDPPPSSTALPKPNTEIKMEALVRVTFRNLFNEGHFFNNPMYGHKMDSSQPQQQPQSQLITTMQHSEYRWVQVEVMVKEMSIGLILERLDRIGVGSLVGTVAIFKSELCQTASVDEHAAVPNAACAGTAATATAAVTTTTTTTATVITTAPTKKVDNANTVSIRSVASNVVAAAVSTFNPSLYNPNNDDNKEGNKAVFAKKSSFMSVSTTNSKVRIDDTQKEKPPPVEGEGGEPKQSTVQVEKKEMQDEDDTQNNANAAAAAAAARAEWKAAASRLRVEQVKEQIHEQAKLSFDFLALLTIASILAGIGLIVNSTVVIVASMLVSPIMGPVMGMTFGSRVLDWKLARSSFLVELIALLLAIGIGVLVGLGSSWSSIAEEWPTEEMSSRGSVVGLLTGVAIAIPSGMGVALSILGNHTASLVGVAISASLLPPAVNAGICWIHAILIRSGAVMKDENYGNEEGSSFGFIGGISFALTIVNIVCIWVSGMLMFAMKEVTPSANQKQSASAFWARDIKVARAIQRGNQTVDMDVIKDGIQKELQVRREEGKPFVPPMVPASMSLASSGGTIPPRRNSVQNEELLVEVEEEEIDSIRYVGLQTAAHFLGYDREDNIEATEKEMDAEEGNDTSDERAWGVFSRWFQ